MAEYVEEGLIEAHHYDFQTKDDLLTPEIEKEISLRTILNCLNTKTRTALGHTLISEECITAVVPGILIRMIYMQKKWR